MTVDVFLKFLLTQNMEQDLAPASIWIVQKYQELEESLQLHLQTYELSHSIEEIYHFLWDYYADWYVEYLKTDASQIAFAKELFKQFVVTVSPYVPFEAEALWKDFFHESDFLGFVIKDHRWSYNILQQRQKVGDSAEFEKIIGFISTVRSLRGLFGIDPALKIRIFSSSQLLQDYSQFIQSTGRTEVIQQARAEFYTVTHDNITYHIDILAYIKDIESEVERSEKLILDLEKQITGLKAQLNNEGFLRNAEAYVIEEKKQNLALREKELLEQGAKIKFLRKQNV